MDLLASSIKRIIRSEGSGIIGTPGFWGRLLDENAFKNSTSGEKNIFKSLNENSQVTSLVFRGMGGERLTETEVRITVSSLAESKGYDKELVSRLLLSLLIGSGAVNPQFTLDSQADTQGLPASGEEPSIQKPKKPYRPSSQPSAVPSDTAGTQLNSQSKDKTQGSTDVVITITIVAIGIACIALCVIFWSVARYVLGTGTLVFLICRFHETLGNLLKSFRDFMVDNWVIILIVAIIGLLIYLIIHFIITYWTMILVILAILAVLAIIIFFKEFF